MIISQMHVCRSGILLDLIQSIILFELSEDDIFKRNQRVLISKSYSFYFIYIFIDCGLEFNVLVVLINLFLIEFVYSNKLW